jgi:hypothetical protein
MAAERAALYRLLARRVPEDLVRLRELLDRGRAARHAAQREREDVGIA